MKKLLCLISFAFYINAGAQQINTIQVIPANPTTLDTISLIVDMWFTSGSCDQHMQQIFISGNSIYCSTLHCTGMLTVICGDVDTFKINPLPSGNYTSYIQVDQGGLPAPCTPGIVAGDSDSVTFVVTPVTGISNYVKEDFFSVKVNENDINMIFKNPDEVRLITLTDITGRLLFSSTTVSDNMRIIKPTSRGAYLLNVVLKEGTITSRKIISDH